jgi:hypothetical protein
MNEVATPSSKHWPLSSEDFHIPNLPNVPACNKSHFQEKEFPKTLGGRSNLEHIITTLPFDLQIVPSPDTTITLEKQMLSILI